MYKRYEGNSGRMRRVDEVWDRPAPERKAPDLPQSDSMPDMAAAIQDPSPEEPEEKQRLPSVPGHIRPKPSQHMGKRPFRLSLAELDGEDLLLLAIFYLLYRESRDEELLYIMAALVLL